ncbi:LOW QUALITY PROTEIN: dehydrodolichyl diphosphate synthase complex subunit NUS1 [Nylanderia fulva]|uniref:LOW QUALITY PROTEIN: dehydrodolichyl diphosphate synthase complex subunit NUS1 n=1 Tax=Nylanderia fulva TaxID=613905 RepID=UPI0010FB83D0|nr:LOW QUALITY PROTEIN: dehydrodolichyl diphosphate synthase complex subunit NUS1 [Nylanderia fulva]
MYMYTLHTLLKLVHFLYNVYLEIFCACITMYQKLAALRRETPEFDNDNMLLYVHARTKKLPGHLVIVLGLCDESVLDCVRIIGWCIALNIPYISFFDRNGFLKKNEANLKEEFAKKRPDLIERIIWNSHTKLPSQNGITDSRWKINVSLLSDIDNKGKIATLVQTLARAVLSGNFDPEDIEDQVLSEKFDMRGMPNPDLALIYGYTCSTHGLLPWHTRTTEFCMLPLYVSISLKDFMYLLERYSKTVQRYGK